jgi:hypothetical protein
VGERLKTAVLKNKNADSLSKQKIQQNSLASRKIATIFLSVFVPFLPVLREPWLQFCCILQSKRHARMSVTHSIYFPMSA